MKKVFFILLSTLISLSLVISFATITFLLELRSNTHAENNILRENQHKWIMLRPYGLWSFPESKNKKDGYRIPENIAVEKPINEIRIAVLGGSAIWGHGVRQQETISAFMEKIIGANSSHSVKVINFGMPGYTSSNEVVLLALKVIRYQPDFVIIFDGWNDIYTKNKIPHYNTFIELYKKIFDQVNLGISTAEIAIRNVLFSTYTGRLFSYLALPAKSIDEKDKFIAMKKAAIRDISRSIRSKVDYTPTVYKNNLKAIAGILKSFKIKHIFVFQPYDKNRINRKKEKYYLQLEKQFIKACEETNSTYYSYVSIFSNLDPDLSVFRDNVHFTKLGNEIIASTLISLINKELPLIEKTNIDIQNGRLILLNFKEKENALSFKYILRNVVTD